MTNKYMRVYFNGSFAFLLQNPYFTPQNFKKKQVLIINGLTSSNKNGAYKSVITSNRPSDITISSSKIDNIPEIVNLNGKNNMQEKNKITMIGNIIGETESLLVSSTPVEANIENNIIYKIHSSAVTLTESETQIQHAINESPGWMKEEFNREITPEVIKDKETLKDKISSLSITKHLEGFYKIADATGKIATIVNKLIP